MNGIFIIRKPVNIFTLELSIQPKLENSNFMNFKNQRTFANFKKLKNILRILFLLFLLNKIFKMTQ